MSNNESQVANALAEILAMAEDQRALAQSYGRLQIVDVIEDALRADPRQLVATLTRLCANVRRQHNTYLPDAVPTTRDDVDTAPHETVTEGRVVR